MDYIPPERPALIAQARDNEEHRPVYKFIIDFGQIQQMNDFGGIKGGPNGIQMDIIRDKGLKPGQYVDLGHSVDPSCNLSFYLQEHKPCSVPTFAAFRALTKLDPARPEGPLLSEKQIGKISEILGDKLDKAKFETRAMANEIGGRKVLLVSTFTKKEPKVVGCAYYLVSDAKNRVVEEIGFKGVREDNKYWLEEAQMMLDSVKFIQEKSSDDEEKKAGKR